MRKSRKGRCKLSVMKDSGSFTSLTMKPSFSRYALSIRIESEPAPPTWFHTGPAILAKAADGGCAALIHPTIGPFRRAALAKAWDINPPRTISAHRDRHGPVF